MPQFGKIKSVETASPSCSLSARLLDILLPDGGYAVQMVEAYFDESGSHDGSPVLCVAGYVFEKESCSKLDAAWSEVLSKFALPYFRMSACAQGTKPFDVLTKDQRIEVETEMIGLIKQFASFGIAVTVEPKMFDAIVPSLPEIGSAYTFCAHTCLSAVKWWADKTGYHGDIAYFFESGHRSQSQANDIMNILFKNPAKRMEHRYVSHTFADKEKVRPLQAADLLAWQWHTDQKRRTRGNNKPRLDCVALVENQNPPHRVMHYKESQLREMAGRALSRRYPTVYPWPTT